MGLERIEELLDKINETLDLGFGALCEAISGEEGEYDEEESEEEPEEVE